MSGAGEIRYDDDCLVITIDIVDCPMAEIPLTDVFDVPTMTLCKTNHNKIHKSVLQQLQDTTWLSEDLLPSLVDPGFGRYHARDRNFIISLRKPALQRLIKQRLQGHSQPWDLVHVPILIRFNGGFGARHTNLRRRIQSIDNGGLGYLYLFARRIRLCRG